MANNDGDKNNHIVDNILTYGIWSHEENNNTTFYGANNSLDTPLAHDTSNYIYTQLLDDETVTDLNLDPCRWLGFDYQGSKLYMPMDYMYIKTTSRKLNNSSAWYYPKFEVTIDGTLYKFKLLSEEEFEAIPEDVIAQTSIPTGLNFISYSKEWPYFYHIYSRVGNKMVASTSSYDEDDITNCFLPVLYPIPTVKMGMLQLDGSNFTQPTSYRNIKNNTTFTPSVAIKQEDNDSNKWEWVEMVDADGKKKYVSKIGAFRGLQYSIIKTYFTEVTIDNKRYSFRVPTLEEWQLLAKKGYLYNVKNKSSSGGYSACLTPNISGSDVVSVNYMSYSSEDIGSEFSYSITDQRLTSQNGFSGNIMFIPMLELLNTPPTISGVDSDLGDKTSPFSIEYTVDDIDTDDSLTVSCKLNDTIYITTNNAVRNQVYTFEITSSMFANLVLYETNSIEISVNDGMFTTTRTYTFRKTNTAPVINYTGSLNLGLIDSKPTIDYSVTDAEGDEITITERLNSKVLQTYTVTSGTECTVQISNLEWLGCGNSTNTIEINARDAAGGSSNLTITFVRAIDRIEVITNPIRTDNAVTKISLEVGWNTEGASGQVFVCNNGYDESPTWEDMTDSVDGNTVYSLTNTTKTASEWGVSVKVIVKKDGGSTGEVSLYSIKGTYE